MIAPWMTYALAVAAGAALAALAAERALGALGRSRRWVWALSLAVSALAPIALPIWAVRSAARPADPVVQQAYTSSSLPPVLPPVSVREVAAPVDWAALLEAVLWWSWALASLAGIALLLGSAVSLHSMREGWRRRRVAGVQVLVSGSTGPAVVGCLAPSIVIPEWVLRLPSDKQRLILAHEREHAQARDPLLLATARLVATLFPWNLPLWWQLRRLQLAVEMDCDRRVLANAGDVECYGSLLLEVGQRSTRSWIPAPAFSQPSSFLEQRIRDMTTTRPRNRSIQAAALAALLAAAPVALYAAPVVSHPALARLGMRLAEKQEPFSFGVSARSRSAASASTGTARGEPANTGFRIVALASDPTAQFATADTVPDGIGGFAFEVKELERVPELSNRGAIGSIMERLYPRLLQDAGIGGTVVAQIVIEADGVPNMRTAKIVDSDNEQLAFATLHLLERFRFRPGRARGENVRVQMPVPIVWQPKSAATASAVGYGSAGNDAERTAATNSIFGMAEAELTALRETLARAAAQGDERATVAAAQTLARAGGLQSEPTRASILERAKILVAQRYPSLLAETAGGTATLFVIVAPDGQVRESRVVRAGEEFSWPAGTPTNFRKVTAIRDVQSLEFAPALIGTGIIWMEL